MQLRVQTQKDAEKRNVRYPGAKLVPSEQSHIIADPLLRDVIDFG